MCAAHMFQLKFLHAASLLGRGRDAYLQENATFKLTRKNTPTFKHHEDLDIDRFLDVLKYGITDLFKKVAAGMTE